MNILSLRKYQKVFFNQIMYEWEDDISLGLKMDVKKPSIICYAISKFLDKRNFFHRMTRIIRQDNKKNLAFLMFPFSYSNFCPYSIVPIFLDTFEKYVEEVKNAIKNIDVVVFTNYEMYLEQKNYYPNKKIFYIPLGIATRWVSEDVPNKKIDVVQVGRPNSKLHEWMLQYCKKNPKVEYVYRDTLESQEYISTTRGKIGMCSTREEYIDLLKSSKISLVSTPGADDKSRTGKYDFFTPRFFESACCYCKMLGRYSNNAEAEYLHIDQVCDNVDSYEEFELKLSIALSTSVNKELFLDFTKRNMLLNRLKNSGLLEELK